MLRFLTAGESYGRTLVVILEGVPAGLSIDAGGSRAIFADKVATAAAGAWPSNPIALTSCPACARVRRRWSRGDADREP
jgi:hypothetical protein